MFYLELSGLYHIEILKFKTAQSAFNLSRRKLRECKLNIEIYLLTIQCAHNGI
jgi:hypothetical protein